MSSLPNGAVVAVTFGPQQLQRLMLARHHAEVEYADAQGDDLVRSMFRHCVGSWSFAASASYGITGARTVVAVKTGFWAGSDMLSTCELLAHVGCALDLKCVDSFARFNHYWSRIGDHRIKRATYSLIEAGDHEKLMAGVAKVRAFRAITDAAPEIDVFSAILQWPVTP